MGSHESYEVISVHKVASSTAGRVRGREVRVIDQSDVRAGDIVVVLALEEKSVYDQLELVGGRMAKISKGDVIAGTIGARQALKGFVGHAPRLLAAGDVVHILNLGGIVGLCTSANKDYGQPLKVKVLGVAVGEDGRTLSIRDGAVPAAAALDRAVPPLVVVAGSCMNAGKTRAACEIVHQLNLRGAKLGALKVSGVACLRDTLNMQDHGAVAALSFLDAGEPSTAGFEDLAPLAKGLLNALAARNPGLDAIVVELGDGIVGGYGVGSIYADAEIVARTACHVMCANDLVAAWGAKELSERLGRAVDIMSGPATDNEVGEQYVERDLGVVAANARTSGAKLADAVEAKLKAFKAAAAALPAAFAVAE